MDVWVVNVYYQYENHKGSKLESYIGNFVNAKGYVKEYMKQTGAKLVAKEKTGIEYRYHLENNRWKEMIEIVKYFV